MNLQHGKRAEEGFRSRLSVLVEAPGQGSGRGILFQSARDIGAADVVAMASLGGICTVTINEPLAMRLALTPQTPPAAGDSPYFVSSVEARACAETGISAQERALTMRTLAAPDVSAADIATPGHVMVQVARNILRDQASLPELANLFLAASANTRFAAWSWILDDSGELASSHECVEAAERLGADLYHSDDVAAFGRASLKPWTDVIEFSKARFGD